MVPDRHVACRMDRAVIAGGWVAARCPNMGPPVRDRARPGHVRAALGCTRRSIFQSKNDTEIDFRFQRKMILKRQRRTAGDWRPFSCLSGGTPDGLFLLFGGESRIRRRALRGGVGETAVWFSTLPCGAALGGGNVGILPPLRDFQGAGGRGGNLFVVFHAFHRPVISTALSWRLH
jgi:hypothetical protein